jgi:hypothetical protein
MVSGEKEQGADTTQKKAAKMVQEAGHREPAKKGEHQIAPAELAKLGKHPSENGVDARGSVAGHAAAPGAKKASVDRGDTGAKIAALKRPKVITA